MVSVTWVVLQTVLVCRYIEVVADMRKNAASAIVTAATLRRSAAIAPVITKTDGVAGSSGDESSRAPSSRGSGSQLTASAVAPASLHSAVSAASAGLACGHLLVLLSSCSYPLGYVGPPFLGLAEG